MRPTSRSGRARRPQTAAWLPRCVRELLVCRSACRDRAHSTQCRPLTSLLFQIPPGRTRRRSAAHCRPDTQPTTSVRPLTSMSHDRVVDNSYSANLVPLKSLCIEPGKAVYVLYLDMVCINYDGNVVDAALLAANATLRTCALAAPRCAKMRPLIHRTGKLPTARWDEDEGAAIEDDTAARSTSFASEPVVSASFGVFDGCVEAILLCCIPRLHLSTAQHS